MKTQTCLSFRINLWLVALPLAVSIGCGKTASVSKEPIQESMPTKAGIHFDDVTSSSGIRFTARTGCDRYLGTMLELVGSGAAFVDFDRDGMDDLFIAGGGGFEISPETDDVLARRANARIVPAPCELFRGRGDWSFVPTGEESGLKNVGIYSHGAIAADYDHDGFVDLLVTGHPNVRLLRNSGDGTFQDVTAEAGLLKSGWVTAAAWGDIDRDGHYDLYLCRYLDWSFAAKLVCLGRDGQPDACAPRDFDPLPDSLMISTGDGAWIEQLDAGVRSDGKGLGVVIVDLDADGDNDIYVANDTTANFLYRNDGKWPLVECGFESGVAFDAKGAPDGSMGCEVLDFNNDGRADIFVTNFERGVSALYKQTRPLAFDHISQTSGLAAMTGRYIGWGIAARDFDGDGDTDLCAVNGHSNRSPTGQTQQPAQVFENLDGKRFGDRTDKAGSYFQSRHNGRGLATADVDHDGLPDLAIIHANEPATVLRNSAQRPNVWLGIEAIGRTSPRDAIGAKVVVTQGGMTQTAFLTGGGSYLSTSSNRRAFVFRDATIPVRVQIDWPNGSSDHFESLDLGKYHVLLQHREE